MVFWNRFRRIRRVLALTGVAVLACGGGAEIVRAQQAQGESVMGRPRPEYDPLGIYLDDAMDLVGRGTIGRDAHVSDPARDKLGSFLLKTSTEFTLGYDDNVYRTETGEVSDFLVRLRPSFTAESDWANHSLKLTAGGGFGRYIDTSEEKWADLNVGLDGKLDIDTDETLQGKLSWSRNHEERGSPDDLGQPDPTVFYTTRAEYIHEHKGQSLLFTRIWGNVTYFDYIDNGSTNNDDRDRLELNQRGRIGAEVADGTEAFLEAGVNTRIYDEDIDDTGRENGSHGYEVLVGGKWDYSGVTFFEAGVGYLSQSFEEPTFPTVSGLAFNAKMIWNPTGLVTVTGAIRRSVEETSLANVSGILATTYEAGTDWEALYNLLLSTKASYKTQEYQGNGRSDETITLELSSRYMISRNWQFRSSLTHTQKDSTQAGSDYTNNRLIFTLLEQL